jgi:4-diphosphocytidyl-2-C-methyl-D-erythritol kinase
VEAALREQDLPGLASSLGNELTPVTGSFVTEVAVYERELIRAGALGACMSGSGTCVYGIFSMEEEAQAATRQTEAPFAGVYEPVARGVQVF